MVDKNNVGSLPEDLKAAFKDNLHFPGRRNSLCVFQNTISIDVHPARSFTVEIVCFAFNFFSFLKIVTTEKKELVGYKHICIH